MSGVCGRILSVGVTYTSTLLGGQFRQIPYVTFPDLVGCATF